MKRIFKSTLAILLTTVMMLGAAPLNGFVELELPEWLVFSKLFSVEANAETYSGSCGENLTWKLDKETGELVISGTGDMTNWTSYKNVPWYSYRSIINSLIIDNNVVSVGERAFSNCNALINVSFGNSITNIGDYAFDNCDSLTNIIIPDNVTNIGYATFSNCDSLTSIKMGDGVANIGISAFAYCDSLTSVTMGDGVANICIGAFASCDSLTSITIPDSVTSIETDAFSDCYALTSVTIGKGVTSIASRAFKNCEALTSIVIDANNNFYSNDENGVLYNKDKTIFVQCPEGSITTTYKISQGVTFIGNSAFYDYEALTSIIIPDTVTIIGASAFDYCDGLTDVYYAGSEEEWNRISIGNSNTCLTDATIHYNYDPGQSDTPEYDVDLLKLNSTYPTKGATKLSYEDDLVLTFNMDVERNLSTLNEDGICIGIYDYYTDELVKSFDGLYAGYKHSGKTMTFEDAFRKLEPGKKYYILIADDAIYSKTGDSTLYFKGIKDKNEWTFSYLNPTDKTGYSLDVYSSQNVFTVNKGEADDVSIVLSLNGEVCNQDGISLAVADGNIAEISNIRREEEQTVVTIKGKNLGSTIVTVTDAGSRTVQKFPVFVSDKENVYYFSEVEKYSEYSPFVISDMYIDNFNHSEQTDGSHSVTFSVYNMGHSYGAVDVYDQNGNRVESHIINMFDGDYPTDLFTHMDYTQKLVTDFTLDIITGEFLDFSDFKDELYSKETSISITVPENGYYIITKNITASETCLLYNAISLSLDISFEAVGWIGDIVDVSEEMTETVLSKNVDKYLKKLCEVWLENGAMATAQNASASTEEILNIMEELFEAMGTTFIDAVIETIPKVTSKITKEQIAKLFLGVSLKQCGMDIVDNIFYASIKAAKWVAICTDICEYTNSPSAYIYDLQSDKTKVSNGVISYSDVDAETVFHSVLITYGYYADYIDAIHTPEADAELYSISMIKNGEKVQPETPVTVYIPLPLDWDDENIYVYHINDKFEREELNVTVENGYAKFVTGGFSYFVLSNEKLKFVDKIEILNPSNTTISYGDSIILHAETNEALPDGWYIEWTTSNGNFSYDVSADGTTCTITPSKSGNTTFTVTVYDAEGNEISKDEQTMTSKAGFFDKIIAFFKKIFGLTKVIQQSLYTIY